MGGAAAATAAGAGCLEEFNLDELKYDLPESFEYNRELIHENQKQMLREEGYDDILDLETLETEYDSMDDVPESNSIDLTTSIETREDSEYGRMRDDLQGLAGVKTLKDIGTAIATMLHAAVGSYALDDPIAEEPGLYQEAMDGMGFGVKADDTGLSVYLTTQEVEDVEQVYEEHGKNAGWLYAQKTIHQDLLN